MTSPIPCDSPHLTSDVNGGLGATPPELAGECCSARIAPENAANPHSWKSPTIPPHQPISGRSESRDRNSGLINTEAYESDIAEVLDITELSPGEARSQPGLGTESLLYLDTSTPKYGSPRKHALPSVRARQETLARQHELWGKQSRAQRIRDCCRFVRWTAPTCGHKEPRIETIYCGTPGCQHAACQRARTKERKEGLLRRCKALAGSLKARRKTGQKDSLRWRHIVLTTRSGLNAGGGLTVDELRKNAVWLWRAWSQLRESFFRRIMRDGPHGDRLTGGVAQLEYGGAGMVHLHVLVLSKYIPKAWLSKQWEQLTGAKQVDVQEVRVRRKGYSAMMSGLTEVCKYLTKPARSHLAMVVTANASLATFGMRTQRPFGSLHGAAEKPPTPCCDVCGLCEFTHTSPIEKGDEFAIELGRSRLWRFIQEQGESP